MMQYGKKRACNMVPCVAACLYSSWLSNRTGQVPTFDSSVRKEAGFFLRGSYEQCFPVGGEA